MKDRYAVKRRRRVRKVPKRVSMRVMVVMSRVDTKAAQVREVTEIYPVSVFVGKRARQSALHEAVVTAAREHPTNKFVSAKVLK